MIQGKGISTWVILWAPQNQSEIYEQRLHVPASVETKTAPMQLAKRKSDHMS